jgi:hypothetical protein
MKRCPKCNRSYPDENQKFCTLDGGLLVSADQAFDPNATIATRNFSTQPTRPPAPPPVDLNRTVASSPPPLNVNRTTAASSSAPTELFDRQTGPTGGETVIDRRAPVPPARPPSAPLPQRPTASPAPLAPTKKSKVPMIIGLLLLLLVLGVGAIAAVYFVIIRPRLEPVQPERNVVVNTNESTNPATNENVNVAPAPAAEEAYVPPLDTVKFTNSEANLDGKLAEHYLDFSFYYPRTWQTDLKSDVFVKIEKTQEDDTGVYLLENASVSWYNSNGTFDADTAVFQDRIRSMEAQIAPGYPGYRRVSEGETLVNSLRAYEFRFTGTFRNTDKGDLPYWGRVLFIPAGEGNTKGAVITLLATSLAPEISGVEDVGEKGEMPVILDSFRFGSNKN